MCNIFFIFWLWPPGELSAWRPLFYSLGPYYLLCAVQRNAQQLHMPTEEKQKQRNKRMWFAQSMLSLIPENVFMQIVFHSSYLDFSLELRGIQQSHFEGGCFESFGAFLGRFEVLVWGRLLRHVIWFSVFIQILGVLFLYIYKKQRQSVTLHARHVRGYLQLKHTSGHLKMAIYYVLYSAKVQQLLQQLLQKIWLQWQEWMLIVQYLRFAINRYCLCTICAIYAKWNAETQTAIDIWWVPVTKHDRTEQKK